MTTERGNVRDGLHVGLAENAFDLDIIRYGAFTVDHAGALTSINPALEVVSGYAEAEVLGRPFTDFAHPDDVALARECFQRALAGIPEPLEYRVLTRTGEVRWVRVSGWPLPLSDGRTGMRAVVKDITEEHHVQEAVAQRDERVRSILETVSDVILLVAPDATVQYVTPSIERVLGYRAEEIVGQNAFNWVCAGDRERLLATFADHARTPGQTNTVEFCARHKDGSVRWLESVSTNRVHDPSVGAIVVSSRDVTERREAAAALQASEEKYRDLVESINDAIFALDVRGWFTYMSPVMYQMTGYHPEDVVGHHYTEFIHPDDVTRAVREFEKILGGQLAPTEFRVLDRRGTVRWLRTFSRLIAIDGGVVGMRGVATDITGRKRAEDKLRESELKFRTLAESTAAAIFIHRGSHVYYANPAAAALTGYTTTELAHMDFWDLLDPRFRAQAVERGAQRLAGMPVPARAIVKILRKDGAARWVDFTAAHIDYDGQPAVLGTAIDITERRAAAHEAQQRRNELAHVLRVNTMGEMAATLAHELNQPLAALVNFARGCCRRAVAGAPVSELVEPLEQIAAQALRAGEVMRRVRGFVQKAPPKREWVSLNDLVVGAVRLVETEILRDRITLRIRVAPDLPPVELDTVQIEQVIVNLLRNGIEAMPASCGGERTLEVTTSMPNVDEVEVMIRDAGEGLRSEAAAQLFAPFFTTKPNGLGMGLSISRSIIEAHGGRIWITSTPGHGTTVRFNLPAHPDEAGDAGRA